MHHDPLPHHVLGVDPGSTSGGAALLNPDGTVTCAWAWVLLDRKGGDVLRLRRLLVDGAGEDLFRLSTYEIGRIIACDAGDGVGTIAIEGLFVGQRKHGKANVQDQLLLAESVGELRAALVSIRAFPPRLVRPRSGEWRPAVGIPGNTDADVAEAAAIKEATERTGLELPASWTKAERGAASEAACMAWAVAYHPHFRVIEEAPRARRAR
jgi:hypothetical protein